MQNSAVSWSEGMFLRPHHFQAADRYWAELLEYQIGFCTPYPYGVFRVNVALGALANGVLEFSALKARWPDGTIVSLPENHVERIPLGQRLSEVGTQSITVYLAIPILNEGQRNAEHVPGGMCRYVEFRRSSDEETMGGNRQEVVLRKLNYRVLLSHEELTGFNLLPLIRLQKLPSQDGSLQVDSTYFPPSLTIQSWSGLASVMRTIFDLISGRMQILSEIIKEKSISFSSQSQGDIEKLMLLHALNEAHAELACLVFAAGVHPLVAYAALCRIVGRFSVFGSDVKVDKVPQYDHDDLATIFYWAHDQIRRLIYSIKEDEYEQRYFVGSGRGMMVQLEPTWFGLEWDWYIGVDPINLSKDECYRLLAKGGIDWVLGSSDQVEQYMTKRQPGVVMKSASQPPRALPSRGNWVFFQIKREGHPWQQVQATQTMAMRVKSEQIANLDSLDGSRRLRLNIGSNTYGLEFAIFAVRKRI